MALSGSAVDITAAVPSAAGCGYAGATCETDCATSSAACRSASAGEPTFFHGKGDASHPSGYLSSFASNSSLSASLPTDLPEKTACAAEDADMPALLVVCLSPELLRSPTCVKQHRQRVQQEQESALHRQQAEGQPQQSSKQHMEDGSTEELQGQPKEQSATPGRVTAGAGSRVCLPPDSAGYIFLAEQFLPSLGLPIESGISSSPGKMTGASSKLPVPPASPALAQQGRSPHKGAEDHRLPQHSKHREEQHQQERVQCGLETDLPRRRQHGQPRLHQLPASCLLRTKYYEAPLRLLYQFFEPRACDSGVRSFSATSTTADVNCSESKYSCSGAPLHLTSPPEAVLLLCSSLADLYRVHELLGTAPQETSHVSAGSSGIATPEAATGAAAAAGAEGGHSLPLPHVLRRPPYIVLGSNLQQQDTGAVAAAPEQVEALAVGVGQPNGGETPDARRPERGGAEGHCTLRGCTFGASETAEEGEVTSGNWLSTVPVKLLVCFDADEKETEHSRGKWQEMSATSDTCSLFPPCETYENYEDPSVILFFENDCFLEKVSLSLPTRILPQSTDDAGAASFSSSSEQNEAEAVAGRMAAGASAATSREPETAEEAEGTCRGFSWCSVRPLLGTTVPLLREAGMNNGSMRALQRLVEALHCHMWPNMRLLANGSTHGRTGKVVASATRSQSGERSIDLHSSNDSRVSGSNIHSNTNKADATNKHIGADIAAGRGYVGQEELEIDVREQGKAVAAAGLPTSGGAAAACKLTTEAPESAAITGKAGSVEAVTLSSDKAPILEAVNDTTEGGCIAAPRSVRVTKSQECGKRPEDKRGRKDSQTTTEEIPFQAWESLARTVRETRLEAHQLSRAERTAKAEILTLQLAHALGLSDDEDDE